MYNLAIIIPIYQVLPYIYECVNSLRSQYSQSFQYIFVDDGCPEESLTIAVNAFPVFFAAKNVSIIRQKNGGVSTARNNALAKIDAKYFTFIDADDVILNGYTDLVVGSIEQYDVDIIEFNFTRFVDRLPAVRNTAAKIRYKGDVELVRNAIFGEANWYCWRRIFKAETFAHLSFIEGIFLQDIVYCSQALLEDVNILVLDNILVGYRDNPTGVTNVFDCNNEMLTEKWRYSFQELYKKIDSDHRFDFRISAWVDALVVKKSPNIYLKRIKTAEFPKNYFSRCRHILKYSMGEKRLRQLFMLTLPTVYYWLARLSAGYKFPLIRNHMR
jgi:glycosyltransferase involved in cell wall biosynthesis